MHLEFLTLEGRGEVHLNPYSYTYTGRKEDLIRYLESEPTSFSEVGSAPDSMGDAEMVKITDDRMILKRLGMKMRNTFGIHSYEIIE